MQMICSRAIEKTITIMDMPLYSRTLTGNPELIPYLTSTLLIKFKALNMMKLPTG